MTRAGDVVGGKYRLIHPLGIGGMGTVWRAEHLALKQQVALKLLHVRNVQVERTIKRFQREAQIAASIRHRNIVYISDFGTDREEPYIVMELLQGVPLSERMVVGEPLGVATFLSLIDETLQGLSAVHAAGVVHRDMKPENIFLVHEAGGGVYPKLLDFGVSRSTERNQGHTITREGIVMGTPEYVSPEQARGRPADVRSDIYSLGVVMYEALAGRLPFHADNTADLIVAVLNNTPLPLSTLRPELGQALSDLVGTAMRRDPEERFQTAEGMRAAIASLLVAEPRLEKLSLPKRYLQPSEYPSPLSKEPPGARAEPAATEFMPRSHRARWMATGAAAVVLLALSFGLAGGESSAGPPRTESPPKLDDRPVYVPLPSIPPEVLVELKGMPEAAIVHSEGAVIVGDTVRFPRDTGMREILVEVPGKEPWRVVHDSSGDGRYQVTLVPEKKGAKRRPSPAKKPGLLRRPDF